MNEMYFKISSIEKKMDSNKALKTMMKAVAVIALLNHHMDPVAAQVVVEVLRKRMMNLIRLIQI